MPDDLADREWRLIPEESRPGPLHMALEEVAAETAVAGGPRTVRAFRWAPSALSLGYRQDAESVDWERCAELGIDVTRRQTGGGGIYHDRDADVSYSVIAPADELPGDLMDCYELCCEPVLDALDRLGVDAGFASEPREAIHQPSCYLREIDPAHDVVAGGGDEQSGGAGDGVARKISGNAQYRQRDAVIQHGSISYALRPDRHLETFAAPGADAADFRKRVTSIRREAGVDRATAVRTLEDALAEWADARIGGWTDEELERARELASRKYGAEAWTRDREVPDAEADLLESC